MRERSRACAVVWALTVALTASVAAAPAHSQDDTGRGYIVLTSQVLDAWMETYRDPRVSVIYADSTPDLEDEDDDGTGAVEGLKALVDDEELDRLVKLHGFTGAPAWVDATLRMNSGIICSVMIAMDEEYGGPTEDQASPEYKAYREEFDKEVARLRELWGPISDAEQALVMDALDDVRMVMVGGGPLRGPTLKLEGLQRWIACDRDARIGAVLDEIGKNLEEGPATLKQLILTASVRPEIDAAVREQGFAGGHAWADVTMRVVGAALEAGISMKLEALDAEAAEHTPEEYQGLVDRQLEALADVRLAFGARPDEDMGLVSKYRKSVFKALGSEDGDQGEQTT